MIDIASGCAKRTYKSDLWHNRCVNHHYFLIGPQGNYRVSATIDSERMSLARDILSEHIYYNSPTAFTHEAVAMQPDLFVHRAVLFYTPTENLPEEFVGSGILDITLSLPTPDYLEYQELRGYSSPRLWFGLTSCRDRLGRFVGRQYGQPILSLHDLT